MKIGKLLQVITFSMIMTSATAQTETPKGFSKGTIVLADGSSVSGLVREKIRSNASLVLLSEGNKKKNYDGSDLLSAEIGEEKFICMKGDFFKVICDGDLKFLQKASDASGKPMYNGSQAIFANGTEGDPGDYFIYDKAANQLTHVTRKTVTVVAPRVFAGCEEAIAKAQAVKDKIPQLEEAVVIYNNRKH